MMIFFWRTSYFQKRW